MAAVREKWAVLSKPPKRAPLTVAGMDIPIIAGTISTVIFAVSNLPMLRKALRTRDVSSYSQSSLVLINGANVVYSLYVFALPFGPIWALHSFYVVTCAVILVLCLRQRRHAADSPSADRAKRSSSPVGPSRPPSLLSILANHPQRAKGHPPAR